MTVLDLNEFVRLIATELSLPVEALASERELVDDLAFDSLRVFELVLIVEDLIDAPVPESMLPSLVTIGDVYELYRVRASST